MQTRMKPRFNTVTKLNERYAKPMLGMPFYSKERAIETIDTLVGRRICRSGVVVDTITNEIVYTAEMFPDTPYNTPPNYI